MKFESGKQKCFPRLFSTPVSVYYLIGWKRVRNSSALTFNSSKPSERISSGWYIIFCHNRCTFFVQRYFKENCPKLDVCKRPLFGRLAFGRISYEAIYNRSGFVRKTDGPRITKSFRIKGAVKLPPPASNLTYPD